MGNRNKCVNVGHLRTGLSDGELALNLPTQGAYRAKRNGKSGRNTLG